MGVGDEDKADEDVVGRVTDWVDAAGEEYGNMTTAGDIIHIITAGVDGVVDNTVDGDTAAVGAVVNITSGAGGLVG